MKKFSILNLLGVTTVFASSATISCNTFNQSKWTKHGYGYNIMESTEDLAKFLLMVRSENLNIGSSSPTDAIFQLNDKDYDGQLATIRDKIASANYEFSGSNISPGSVDATPIATLLTAVNGDTTNLGLRGTSLLTRKMDLSDSSVFSYMTESGPLKTLFASNLGILTKEDDLFSYENIENVFSQQMEKYDNLSLAKNKYNSDELSKNGLNFHIFSEKVDVGRSSGITLIDSSGDTDVVGSNDVKNAVNQNTMKQLRSFNDISRLVSLVSSKQNINNLWTFTNEMFAINNPSSWRIFANLGGVIFSNVYKDVLQGYLFNTLFKADSIGGMDSDFVATRSGIISKINKWLQKLQSEIDFKAWKNGRYQDSTVAMFSKEYNVAAKSTDPEDNESLSTLLYDLYDSYLNFFERHSSKEEEQKMTDLMYNAVNDLLNNKVVHSILQPAWIDILNNLLPTLDATENKNPNKNISFEDFVMGLLGIFVLSSNKMLDSTQIDNETQGISSYAEIHNLDLSNEKNIARVRWSLGYQNGEIKKDSVFDRIYTMFNDYNSSQYKVMNALFLSDQGAIRKVLKKGLDETKENSINAIFNKKTNGIDVEWDFSDPKYNPKTKTVTYTVTYNGPGDNSLNYNLHEKPIVAKEELKSAAPYLHTVNKTGVWDKLMAKFDADKAKYDFQWFKGYDGVGSEYQKTSNTYRISFTDVSQNGTSSKWGLSNLIWYHNGKEYYDLFE